MSSPRPESLVSKKSISTSMSPRGSLQKQNTISSTRKATNASGVDDNASEISRSSTMKFGHVSYSEFESQVKELCCHLWPAPVDAAAEKPFIKRMQKRVAGAFGLKEPSSPLTLVRPSKEMIFEPMRGGSFNRVIGVTTIDEDKTESRMVLRVARGDWAHPEHDATILQFVMKHAVFDGIPIPIPEIIAHDFTSDNPLGAPYLLQKRIAGSDLESKTRSYPDLTHEQKKLFIKQFSKILLDLRSIEHPYAGKIDARIDKTGEQIFTVGPFPLESESAQFIHKGLTTSPFYETRDFGVPEEVSDDPIIASYRAKHRKPHFFLISQFGRERALNLIHNPSEILNNSIQDQLATVADQMNDFGCFTVFEDEEAQPFCLSHHDLDPRNIMVDIQEDGYPKITGILDWDLAMFAPKWVHCQPPMWIWNWLDGESEDQRKANDNPPTEEQKELKELFEECVGSEFNVYAYHTAYRLARQLFRFSLSGIHCNQQYTDAEALIEEWDEFYKKEMESPADSKSQSEDSEAKPDDVGEEPECEQESDCHDDNELDADEEATCAKGIEIHVEASTETCRD